MLPVAQLVQVAGLRPPTYRFPVPGTASVFSCTYVTPEQLAWLAQQFGGWVRDDNPDGWTVVVGPGYYDIVGLENGTNDIPGMPPQIIQPVARWLGRQPQYRLSLIFGDTQGCNERAWDIALFFARWWPAIWSNHSTDPVVPLGSWWTR